MASGATRIGSLADILQRQADASGELPVDALAGFDAVAQFSHSLLNRQVVRSLAQRSMLSLSAYVPWGSFTVPASLWSAIPPRTQIQLGAIQARIEVRLVQPVLSGLQWPPNAVVDRGDIPDTDPSRERVDRRTAAVTWQAEVNLLTARLVSDVDPQSSGAARTGSMNRTGSGPRPELFDRPELASSTDPTPSGSDGRSWNRLPLASGRVVTAATARVVVRAALWRFAMEIDFSQTNPLFGGGDQALTDLLATDAGNSLLAQAVGTLRAAGSMRLTPEIAPAGPISAATVQRVELPQFSVRDVLLKQGQGRFVLALCAELGSENSGVLRLVPSFVRQQDFAFAISARMLAPAYRACWNVAAENLWFVGETDIELPVADNPEETRPGRAQLYASFSNVLDDVAIMPALVGTGDAIRLQSKQRIELLNVWDNDGNSIDLGELGEPQEESFVLPINLFDTGGGSTPGELQPRMQDFVLKLLAILVFPMTEPFSVRRNSVTGFCSSALQTMLVRWTHKTLVDDIRPDADIPEAQV